MTRKNKVKVKYTHIEAIEDVGSIEIFLEDLKDAEFGSKIDLTENLLQELYSAIESINKVNHYLQTKK